MSQIINDYQVDSVNFNGWEPLQGCIEPLHPWQMYLPWMDYLYQIYLKKFQNQRVGGKK